MKLSWRIITIALAMMASAPVWAAPAQAQQQRPLDMISQGRWFIENKDYLGFRVFIKKAYWKKITYGEWWYLKNLVNAIQVWKMKRIELGNNKKCKILKQ